MARPIRSPQDAQQDVGTLWRMKRHGRSARCALFASSSGWEVGVVVDGEVLLRERCATAAAAFEVGASWKLRLLDRGWIQIKPRTAQRPSDGV